MGSYDHWDRHSRHWQHVKSPLKPCIEDVSVVSQIINRHQQTLNAHFLQTLLLGVTPELVRMNWPHNTHVHAVDRCQKMIDTVLPRPDGLSLTASRADWLKLPVEDASIECAVGDGCFTVLNSRQTHIDLCQELQRTLTPTGIFVIRLFVQTPHCEAPDQVFSDLLNLTIGNFHIFKWRLAMALHGNATQGVKVEDIWTAWENSGIDIDELSEHTGWPVAEIKTIEAYRAASAIYSFPTLEQMRDTFHSYFHEYECHVGDYELADRCPTLLLAPASKP